MVELKKLPDRNETPPGNAWKNDKLQREGYANKLTTLIRSLTQPFVISVNSPWGTGKTEFIRMWRQDLLDQGQPCVYFNAWENDFAETPLIAFTGEIQKSITEFSEIEKAQPKSKLISAAKKAGVFAKKLAPLALKISTRNALDSEQLKDLVDLDPTDDHALAEWVGQQAVDVIKSYESKKKSIEVFKTNLARFAQNLADDGATMPLVIFVDELDRCRPNYALELLENIKHLFDVQKIVFVLAIDKQQLVNSVKTLYGAEMDHDGYLRRFIDLEYMLPIPSFEDFTNYLFYKFDMDAFLSRQSNAQQYREEIEEAFSSIAELFQLSLRDQAQGFTRIYTIINAYIFSYQEAILATFLVLLKGRDENVYFQLVNKSVDWDYIEKYMKKLDSGQKFLNGKTGIFLEANLRCCLSSPDAFTQWLKGLESQLPKSFDPPPEAQRLLQLYDFGFKARGPFLSLDKLKNTVEMVNDFRL